MQQVWAFLSDPTNQATLAWLAGGACVAISAVWGAWLKLRKPAAPDKSGDKSPADQVGSAIGAAASGGNVSIGDNVTITGGRIPRGVYALGLAGLAILGFAIFSSGDDVRMENSAQVGGAMSNSSIEINSSGGQ